MLHLIFAQCNYALKITLLLICFWMILIHTKNLEKSNAHMIVILNLNADADGMSMRRCRKLNINDLRLVAKICTQRHSINTCRP